MATVQYTSLYPTGDPVTYDSTNVDYPDANVVDTFGTIWVSKVHGFDMNVLEMASAGKIAFTPSNEHSLDLMLGDGADANVVLKARDAKNLVLENELKTADLTVHESGRVEVRSETSVLRMDSNANLLDAGDSGSNLFVVSGDKEHAFHVGSNEILSVEADGASVSNLYVNGTEFRVPFGDGDARPSGTEGLIFYNTSASRFEGYSSGAWSGLGGVVDVDQDTYVSAESAPGADNDELIFVTSNVERLRVKSDGRVGYGTTAPEFDLDWRGDARFLTSDSNAVVLDSTGFSVDVASGKVHEFSVAGTQISKIDGSGMSTSNLVVNGTDFRVPVGDVLSRPAGTSGQVFYNTSAGRFEGFSTGAWSGLGGVVDVDQDTYITAEASPNSDNDELQFYTAGVERMRIDSQGKLGFGMSNPEYTIDVVGNLRVTGNIVAASTTIGDPEDGGRVMKLAIQADGSDAVIDGKETNDGAGISVSGAPSAGALTGSRLSRFEKSFKWNYNGAGMESLAQKDAWDSESFWKLQGGSFRMGVVNSDSGSETEMIFRINERDELQLVKHTIPSDGTPETYDVIAKFGKGGVEGVASTRGFVAMDADKTSMDTAAGTVEAYIESFSAYSDYKVYGALYPASETPTSAEVVAASSSHGFVSGVLPAAADNTALTNFSTMADGSAIPNAIVKFVAVSEKTSDLSISTTPFVSFVLNDSSVYNTLFEDLEEEVQTETSIDVEYSFASMVWDDLSPADQEIFREWMEDQLIRGAEEKGISVTSVDLNIVSGSIKVTSGLQVPTNDLSKVLKNTLTGGTSTSLLKDPENTSIEFQDRPVEKVTSESVATQVKEVTRIQTVPSINSVSEVGSTALSTTFSFDVSEVNPDFAVTKIYALVLPSAIQGTVIPSKIVSNPAVQEFAISSTTGSIVVVADSAVRNYMYFVAENNATKPVRSNIKRFISDPLSILASSLTPGSDGYGRLIRQSSTDYSVTSSKSVSIFTPSLSATAYMLLYPAGSVPATAADIHADVLGGVSLATATMA